MQSLPHESLLQLLAEVSVAFVGFSMLASVLRPNVEGERVLFFGFRDVAETSLIATLGSIGPLVLAAFDLSQDLTWRIAGGAVGLLWSIGFAASVRRQGLSVVPHRAPKLISTIAAIVILVALTNVLFPSGARHILLIVLCLTNSALLFLFSAFSMEHRAMETQNEESVNGRADG